MDYAGKWLIVSFDERFKVAEQSNNLSIENWYDIGENAKMQIH